MITLVTFGLRLATGWVKDVLRIVDVLGISGYLSLALVFLVNHVSGIRVVNLNGAYGENVLSIAKDHKRSSYILGGTSI
jgi:hypothetical protein